jgi:hypothetical protein
VADKEKVIQERLEYVKHQEMLLFHRIHYFFIGIAFLVTAFVACAVGVKPLPPHCCNVLVNLASVIFLVGWTLSYFFVFVNYHNAKILHQLAEKAYTADFKKNIKEYSEEAWSAEETKIMQQNFVKAFFNDSFNAFSPFKKEARQLGQYTWLVPAGFVIAWILIGASTLGVWFKLHIVWILVFSALLLVFPFIFAHDMAKKGLVASTMNHGWTDEEIDVIDMYWGEHDKHV